MTDSNALPNTARVIEFPPLRADSKPPVGGLVRRMLDTTTSTLMPALAQMFDLADDALFDLAGPNTGSSPSSRSAPSSARHNPSFFDGFREMRLRKALIERAFKEHLTESFRQWETKTALAAAHPTPPMSEAAVAHAAMELSLLGDDDLEEELAVGSVATHAAMLLKGDTHLLERRLAVMRGADADQAVDNPISPESMVAAFRSAMRVVDQVGLPARLVVYKLFDRHVVPAMLGLYRSINADLAQAGILPDLSLSSLSTPPRPSYQAPALHQASSDPTAEPPVFSLLSEAVPSSLPPLASLPIPGPPQAAPSSLAGGWPSSSPSLNPDPVSAEQVLSLLTRLISHQLQASHQSQSSSPQSMAGPVAGPVSPHQGFSNPVASGAPSPSTGVFASKGEQPESSPFGEAPPAALTTTQLIQALSGMRRAQAPTPSPARLRETVLNWMASEQASDPTQFSPNLFGPIRPPSGAAARPSPPPNLSGEHELAIEMISMLFEFILDDHALASHVRANLAKLQIPYLRAAIAEPEWFAAPNHPARVLLNRMAEAGKGCSEADASPVAELIEKTVESIADAADGRSFASQCEQFTSEWGVLRDRAVRIEDRAAQTLAGRERRENARRRVADIIAKALAPATAVPVALREVIIRAWAHHMVVTLLRYGDDSVEISRASRVVDFIARLGAPIPPAESARLELLHNQSVIQDLWRDGLISAGMHESDVTIWENRLSSLCDNALSPLARAAYDHALHHPAVDQKSPRPLADAVDATLAPLGIPHPSIMDALTHPIEAVPTTASIEGPEAIAHPHPALEQARSVKKGQWIELVTDSVRRRLRLSWISGISGRLLFVTAYGQKGWDATRQQLAEAIAIGQVCLVEEGEVMERALTTIRERLRQRLNAFTHPESVPAGSVPAGSVPAGSSTADPVRDPAVS